MRRYCFQIPAQKYINQVFLVSNLGIIVFSWYFENDKFEGDDFKYDNSFLKI